MTVVTDYSVVTPEWLAGTAASMLAEAASDVEAIEALTDPELTFENTVGAIDALMDIVFRADGGLSFLGHVHPDDAVRTAAQAAEQDQSKFVIDTWGRPGLYSRIATYAGSPDGRALTGDRAKLLADTLVRFREAGHQLTAEAKDELGRLSKRAVELSSEFSANLGAITAHVDIPRDELTGMPDAWLDSLEPGDEPGSVRVTSAYPHVFPLLESATSRRWREAVTVMHLSRAVDANRPLLEEQLVVRKQMATLFGEPSWAHHRLHPRMARTPETVEAFYADLTPRLTVPGEAERAVLHAMLEADIASGAADGEPQLGDHDWRYYDGRLRQERHGVDPWVVAEHFPLDAVLTGLLDLTAEMFGIVYEPVELSTWHPDVRGLRIIDAESGQEIATVHVDLFPRDGKFTHAAAFEIVTGRRMPDGTYRHPITAMVTNFTAPTADSPSLLTHGEVVTFFHEWATCCT